MSPLPNGIFAGSTVHEVAQVVAGRQSSCGDRRHTAVITKLVRVMMLAPFLVAAIGYLSRSAEEGAAPAPAGTRWRGVIPWFALGFIAVAGLNSMSVLPHAFVSTAIDADTLVWPRHGALGVSTQAPR